MASVQDAAVSLRLLGGIPQTTTKLALAGTSQSVNVGAGAVVRVVADAAVNLAFGDSSVAATANDLLLPANHVEYFHLGRNTTVAAIGTGNCYITVVDQAFEPPRPTGQVKEFVP